MTAGRTHVHETEATLMTNEPARRRFTGAEGNVIAADILGDEARPTVILLHGGGQTRHSWRRTAQALADKGYCAVCVDQRGHGESDWVSSKHYEMRDFATDLAAVVGQLAPGRRPILVGASLGGLASIHAVGSGLLPQAAGIVLADVAHRANAGGADQLRGFMQGEPDGYASLEAAAAAIDRHMPHRGGRRNLDGLRRNLRQMPSGRWVWHWDPAFIAGAKPGESRFGNEPEFFLADLRRITVPVLLARGALSEIVTEEIAREFREGVPSARYAELAGVGHMVAGDDNAPFTRVLLEFLAEVAAPSASI